MKTDNLQKVLLVTQVTLCIYFLCASSAILIFSLFTYTNYKKQLATIAIIQSEQDFIKGDYRSVLANINLSLSSHFSEIRLLSNEGRVLYTSPPNGTNLKLKHTVRIEIIPKGFSGRIGSVELDLSLAILFVSAFLCFSIGSLALVLLSKKMKNRITIKHAELLESERKKTLNSIASQVSHDIRSPLAALNMIVGTLDALPEEKRQIIRSATQRINDIANQLLQKGNAAKSVSGEKPTSSLEPVMLVSILDSIISEKRVQYREKMQVQIQAELSQGYGLFSLIDSSEFARVISNLINNSVEAFSGEGQITLSLKADSSSAVIAICDNGKGIPSEVLARLGEQGVTHGKEGTQSGSGLGVYHARQMIEAAGGKFQIESTLGVGTTITLTLPRTEEPWWFLRQLRVTPGQKIISFDDDQTIHQIWNGRIKSSIPPNAKVEHLSFSSSAQLEEWVHSNKDSVNSFLVDFEILGQKENGLDVIERLGIGKQSVLVTSRFDEHNVRNRAKILGVKILPKGLAPSVPFQIEAPREKYAAVVIDDDPLVHQMWEMVAKARQHKLVCFSRPEDFFAVSSQVNLASPIFIDVSLGDGIRGEKIAEQVAALGFTDISLSTGYAPGSIQAPACVKRIVGKEPIF